MKRTKHISLLAAIAAVTAMSLTSCDALWGTSVDVGTSPDYYYYGWDGEWLPTLAGAPLISLYYYGGTAYPVSNWTPVHRPGYGPGALPPVSNPPIPNGSIGNIRPGQANAPVPLPDKVPVPTGGNNSIVPSTPIPLGSNPGIQLPPAGSGMKYTPTQGRH